MLQLNWIYKYLTSDHGLQVRALPGADQVPEPIRSDCGARKTASKKACCQFVIGFCNFTRLTTSICADNCAHFACRDSERIHNCRINPSRLLKDCRVTHGNNEIFCRPPVRFLLRSNRCNPKNGPHRHLAPMARVGRVPSTDWRPVSRR